MARVNRNSQVELNFDGLTDSVTNLVGTLILLVVLVMGLSKKSGGARPDPTSDAPRPIEELIGRVESLRAELAAIDREISDIEQVRLPELRKQISDLNSKAREASNSTTTSNKSAMLPPHIESSGFDDIGFSRSLR